MDGGMLSALWRLSRMVVIPKPSSPRGPELTGFNFSADMRFLLLWFGCVAALAPFPTGSEIVENYAKKRAPAQSFFRIFVLSRNTQKMTMLFAHFNYALSAEKQSFFVLFYSCNCCFQVISVHEILFHYLKIMFRILRLSGTLDRALPRTRRSTALMSAVQCP